MSSYDDPLAGEHTRFPLGTKGGVFAVSDAEPSDETVRPFGLRFVTWNPGTVHIPYDRVEVCPDTQVGLLDGEPLTTVLPMAKTTCHHNSDGDTVITLDYVDDD